MGASQLVAVKRIHTHLADEAKFVTMFMDEARVAAKINHPNVCQVFDYGKQDGTPYLAMEYLVGQSLKQVRQAIGKKHVDTFDAKHAAMVALVVADACEGLHAAHELRDDDGHRLDVVHRDVSLDNIFLTYDGYAKVVDFGTVKSRDQRHDTAVGTMKGKMSYMQPEVLVGDATDRRGDVWGLGVIAWELLTGQRLFRRNTAVETLQAVLEHRIAAPSQVRPGIPEAYDEVVLRALSRNPVHRPATARELGRALLDVAARTHGLAHRADVARWLERLTFMTPWHEPGGEDVTERDLAAVQATSTLEPGGLEDSAESTSPDRVGSRAHAASEYSEYSEVEGDELPTTRPIARATFLPPRPPAIDVRSRRWQVATMAVVLANTIILLVLADPPPVETQFVPIRRAALSQVGHAVATPRPSAPCESARDETSVKTQRRDSQSASWPRQGADYSAQQKLKRTWSGR
jgi:serine/threonine-protein kinase